MVRNRSRCERSVSAQRRHAVVIADGWHGALTATSVPGGTIWSTGCAASIGLSGYGPHQLDGSDSSIFFHQSR